MFLAASLDYTFMGKSVPLVRKKPKEQTYRLASGSLTAQEPSPLPVVPHTQAMCGAAAHTSAKVTYARGLLSRRPALNSLIEGGELVDTGGTLLILLASIALLTSRLVMSRYEIRCAYSRGRS